MQVLSLSLNLNSTNNFWLLRLGEDGVHALRRALGPLWREHVGAVSNHDASDRVCSVRDCLCSEYTLHMHMFMHGHACMNVIQQIICILSMHFIHANMYACELCICLYLCAYMFVFAHVYLCVYMRV